MHSNNCKRRPKGKRKHHPRSLQAFADRYGICLATVYNMISRGELETTKLGNRRIITEDQERDCLERGRQVSEASS